MDTILNGVQEAESLKVETKYKSKPETEQVRANPPTPAKINMDKIFKEK